MIANPTIITKQAHQEVLQANIAKRFGVNPEALQRFLVASYDDKAHGLEARDLNVKVVSASQMHYICHVIPRS